MLRDVTQKLNIDTSLDADEDGSNSLDDFLEPESPESPPKQMDISPRSDERTNESKTVEDLMTEFDHMQKDLYSALDLK